MYGEWQDSSHSQSARSALYLKMRAVGSDSATCDACHAPLASVAATRPDVVNEGVTCDVCHTIRASDPRRNAFRPVELGLNDNVKYGPLCDAKSNYFHKMGCSPLHEESKLCGACHLYVMGDVPVYTEYEEWLSSNAQKQGMECQDCHMPKDTSEVAVGAGVRTGVAHHGFFGREKELRKRALELDVKVERSGDTIVVHSELWNRGAGHHVPSGLPGRQLLLLTRTFDRDGHELERDERRYERQLTDKDGKPVPFFRATRVALDNRIQAGSSRTEATSLRAAGAIQVSVELRWIELSPELARELTYVPREETLAEAKLSLDRLPKAVHVGLFGKGIQ